MSESRRLSKSSLIFRYSRVNWKKNTTNARKRSVNVWNTFATSLRLIYVGYAISNWKRSLMKRRTKTTHSSRQRLTKSLEIDLIGAGLSFRAVKKISKHSPKIIPESSFRFIESNHEAEETFTWSTDLPLHQRTLRSKLSTLSMPPA